MAWKAKRKTGSAGSKQKYIKKHQAFADGWNMMESSQVGATFENTDLWLPIDPTFLGKPGPGPMQNEELVTGRNWPPKQELIYVVGH